ncbi:MAG: histidine kinase [Micropruina sp.]|uniref:sensor histidine kinase n=1 Tax=Micropruina sp. TaxID=2737536 RepID=UPI0039E3FF7D
MAPPEGELEPVSNRWLEPILAGGVFFACLMINLGESWNYMWVIDLVTCVGAGLSYRWPKRGAIAVAVGVFSWLVIPGVVPSMSGLALLVNVMAAFRQNLRWKIPLTVASAVLGYVVMVSRSIQSAETHWVTAAVLVLLFALAIGSGELGRRWQRLVQLERERGNAELDAFRLELARDLHDTVAQTLSSTAMRAHLALAEPGLPDQFRADLEWMAQECRASAHDLRELLGRLRQGPSGSAQPLANLDTLRATVADQAERLRAAGFRVEAEVEIERLSAARAQALSAVTVEAVNNIVRHAQPGTACGLRLKDDGSDVVARFTNVAAPATNGLTPPAGMGLTGVRERLALLGGHCTYRRDGRGWELLARLPHGVEYV